MPADRLSQYRDKRDFSKTAEPGGGEPGGGEPGGGEPGGGEPGGGEPGGGEPGGGEPGELAGTGTAGAEPIFVVQKHAARRLHYDFRLEVAGVLASWAVPKGPSYDPKTKRLAVHVEDHPFDYRDFEGSIPGGEYGGGAVIVWDSGTYRNITEHHGSPVPLSEAIEKGHVSIWLEGVKLRGGWSMTRTSSPGDRQESWIMVKRKDERADPDLDIVAAAQLSTKSGRALEDLRQGEGDVWTRGRATWVPPMLAQLTKVPPAPTDEWVFERKFDGLRAVAVRNGDEIEIWSRGHQPLAARFPQLVRALAELPADNFTLDGEMVAFAGEATSFAMLQSSAAESKAVYEVFDVLHLLGTDTRQLPLSERRQLLAKLVSEPSAVRLVERLHGDPAGLLARACSDGWEGIIAKRAACPYVSGRSAEWRKLKCTAGQELVIGGYTDPQGSRRHLGALLVGYYDDSGDLHYAGRVGTGFNQQTLELLRAELGRRGREDSPFSPPPRLRAVHWVEPELVANVGFAEWTRDGMLRHPRFEGLRHDKAASEVRREAATLEPDDGHR